MRLMKPFISLILILTYTVGIAHNVIPHCHINDEASHAVVGDEMDHHHHDHHSHNSDETEGHDHLHHENHVDNDLVDLLLCIFSEVEHPVNSSHELYLPSEARVNKPMNAVTTIYMASLVSDLFTSENESLLVSHSSDDSIKYKSPFRESPPGRGPPVFSS